MKSKKFPMRTCVVTKEKCEKRDLVRVVRTPSGEVVVDSTGKLNGKGAYLKLSSDVLKKARDSKILERVLDSSIPSEVYDDLEKLL